MSEPRKKTEWPIVVGAILALMVMVSLAVYVRGDYSMGAVGGLILVPGGPATVRVYNAKCKASVFTPAAKVESLVRGRYVFVEIGDVWDPYEAAEED